MPAYTVGPSSKCGAAAAEPLTKVDSITMYGEGNGAKLVGDVTGITNQILAGLRDNGIDFGAMIQQALAKHE